MPGNPREIIEADLESTLAAISIASGAAIPEDFRLVTRELLMWDQVNNLYPAIILQAEESQPTFIELGWEVERRTGFRAIVYFKPVSGERPATTANAYCSAIEQAVMVAPHRSGYADWTELDTTPIALIWRDTTTGPVLEATIRFLVVYTYDPREAPVTL